MASKVKALQAWCKFQCDGYRDVDVRNMTSSWKSGLAFCAIIHRYRPDLIDYDSLKKENVFENNKLAFEVADKELDIPALLDAEDMEDMAVPDKLCICTYISQYYNYFRNKEPLGGPGVKAKTATKRLPDSVPVDTPDKKKPNRDDPENWKPEPKSPARRGSSMGDMCTICQKKVYLMERHIEANKLYHRRCLREQQRSTLTRSPNQNKFPDDVKITDQKKGFGKENKKPQADQATTSAAKSSKGLFSRLMGSPKPYGASDVNSNQSKVTEHIQNDRPKQNGHAKGFPLEQNTNVTKSKPFVAGNAKPFEKTNHQPMETNQTNGEVVKSMPFPSAKSDNTAYLKTGSNDKGGGEDSHMLQGLLKTLQGVTRKQQPPSNHMNGTLGSSVTFNGTNEKPSTTHGTTKTVVDDSPPPKSGSGCMFEVKENYITMRNRLKPTGKNDPADSEPMDTNDSRLANNQTLISNSEEKDTTPKSIYKPILKPTSKDHIHSATDHHKVSPKSILKFEETDDITSQHQNTQPKSILKHETDSEGAENTNITRRKSISPPRSILKHVKEKDHQLNGDKTAAGRSSSPRKSILKHNDEESDSDDYSLTSLAKRNQTKSPPPRSILKHVDNEDSLVHELASKFRNRSSSPPKSILKQHSGDEDITTINNAKPKPISILKSKSEDDEKVHVTSKTILKKSHEFEQDTASSHKPILKKKHDDRLEISSEVDNVERSPKSKVMVGKSMQSPHSRPSLLNNVRLEGSDSEDNGDVKTDSNTKAEPTSPKPIAPPRRSILKNVEERLKNGELKPQHSKAGILSGVPKVSHSTHSPETSTSFSAGRATPVGQKSKSNTALNTDGNNFSAFNLNDSIDLINVKSLENGNNSQTKGVVSKPAWQIEMEARQGIRQKDAKTGIGARIEAAHKQKYKVGIEHNDNTKLAWQIEAERKRIDFIDPDKYPKSQPNHYPKAPPPPLPVNPPNCKAKAPKPPSSPTSCPKYTAADKKPLDIHNVPVHQSDKPLNIRNIPVSESEKSDVPVPAKRNIIASDFVNSEEDVFGRTSEYKTDKGLNRTPAFKISPDNSPKSNHKELNKNLVSSNVNTNDVPEWQKEARRRQQDRIKSGFLNDGNNKKLIDLTDSMQSNTNNTDCKDKVFENGVNGGRKKIVPDTRFSFTELSFGNDHHNHENGYEPVQPNGQQASSEVPTPPQRPPWVGKGFRERPLPAPPSPLDVVPKRQVNAEPKMALEDIFNELQTIDQDLRIMEQKGRVLEEQIRKGSDEDMDEDEQMIKWFELVNQKNEFVRRESELMYKQKQQELENRHEEVEYELRLLMATPEHEKTASDKVREDSLLKELVETVSQRNSIVDSMEEDRIRYIEEDQEIAEVMAKKDRLEKVVSKHSYFKEFTKSGERASPQSVEETSSKKSIQKENKKGNKNKFLKVTKNKEDKSNNVKRRKNKDRPKSTGSVFYDSPSEP